MSASIPVAPAHARVAADKPAGLSGRLARYIVSVSLLAAIGGDALIHSGAGFPLWTALVALCAITIVWRAERSVTIATRAWLATAFLFSLGITWRNSEELQAWDTLATIASLGMAAVSLRDGGAALFALRMRDTFLVVMAVVRSVVLGAVPLTLREAFETGQNRRAARTGWLVARAVGIGAALLLVFGSLLRGADPIFASLVRIPDFDFSSLMSHLFVIAALTWAVSGWMKGALVTDAPATRASLRFPFTLGSLDITIALGTLNVLFAAFIATQLGWFFGGERFLHDRTGLTAAEYARQGFFQMTWVVLLVVPVLVATRAMLPPGHRLARRHMVLALPIVGLLGAIIASALLRMRLYVHYYGLTTDRFYPSVFMLWLGVVIVWLALTVLRGWPRPFIAGAILSGLATLAVLNVIDPDAIVARVNVERAQHPWGAAAPKLDLSHLASLRGGAVPLATRATLANSSNALDRCLAARTLLRRFGPASDAQRQREGGAAWRYWNADDAAALSVVNANERDLRRAAHESCQRLFPLRPSPVPLPPQTTP